MTYEVHWIDRGKRVIEVYGDLIEAKQREYLLKRGGRTAWIAICNFELDRQEKALMDFNVLGGGI